MEHVSIIFSRVEPFLIPCWLFQWELILTAKLISWLVKSLENRMTVMIIIYRLLAKWECILHRKLVLNWVLMQVSGCEESVWNCRLFNQRKLSSYSNIIWRAIWMTLWQSAIYQASDLSVSSFSLESLIVKAHWFFFSNLSDQVGFKTREDMISLFWIHKLRVSE